jgi:hypothetical protein
MGQYHRPIARLILLWPNEFNICETPMTKTSFQADIRPLFTERDIEGMSKAFNLGSYDDVKKHAAAIKWRGCYHRHSQPAILSETGEAEGLMQSKGPYPTSPTPH